MHKTMDLTQEQKQIGKSFNAQQLAAYNTFRAGGDEPAKAFALTLQAYPIEGVEVDKTFLQKVAGAPAAVGKFVTSITGGEKILEGAGQALASPFINKLSEETRVEAERIAGSLITRIKDAKAKGDTVRVERLAQQLRNLDYGGGISQEYVDNLVSNEEVVGDAIKLAGTATGAFAGGAAFRAGSGLLKAGALEGLIQGAGFGAGEAVQEEQKINDAVVTVLKNAGLGLGLGAGFAKVLPTVARTASKLRDYFKKGATEVAEEVTTTPGLVTEVIDETVDAPGGATTTEEVVEQQARTVDPTVARTATRRGFSDADAQFMASMSDEDKAFARKAIELTETAQNDKRALYGSRPIDIVGDNLVKKVQPIRTLNSQFGKNVDEAAKGLRGQTIDNSTLMNSLETVLDNQGITLKNGKWDFSNSVYKNTPTIQNELGKAFDSLMDLPNDAYQTHIFKKSIDELVNFGTQGEGLKGTSANILKELRREADQLLDANFEAYKLANDNYKTTRDLLEEIDGSIGTDLTKEKAAAALRRIFSNAQSRGDIKNTIAKIDEVAKIYKVQTGDNLLDQALFTEILEELYGTQAITSLRGEVEKAVGGIRTVVDALRDPIRGLGSAAGEIVERVSGQTENARKQFLKDTFFK